MIDTTGSLLSRQVRRKIERQKNKNATLTVKPEYLKDLCAQPAAVTATTKDNSATWWLWGDLRTVSGMD